MRFPSGEMRTSEIDRRRIRSSIVTLAALAESAPQQIKVQKSKPSFLRILPIPGRAMRKNRPYVIGRLGFEISAHVCVTAGAFRESDCRAESETRNSSRE